MKSLSNFEESTEKHRRTRIMKKTIFGILAVLAGLLLLGFNMNIIDDSWRHIIFSWQMLLITIGLINVFEKDSFLTGIILLIVGSIFLATEFLDVPFKLWQIFWPVLLMGIGAVVIFKHRFPMFNKKNGRFGIHNRFNENYSEVDLTESGTISQTNIFGGSNKIFNSPVFKGGKIVNIFGGGEINFRETQLAPGRIVLDITCIFGGQEIIVPSDWIVTFEMSAVLGGVEDKRYILPKTEGMIPESELIIKGLAVFGGVELKSV